MTMAHTTAKQSAENTEYVRELLRLKQPEFAMSLELAAALLEQELMVDVHPGQQDERGLTAER
jgi:DNA-binding transcriptional regulator YiaG